MRYAARVASIFYLSEIFIAGRICNSYSVFGNQIGFMSIEKPDFYLAGHGIFSSRGNDLSIIQAAATVKRQVTKS